MSNENAKKGEGSGNGSPGGTDSGSGLENETGEGSSVNRGIILEAGEVIGGKYEIIELIGHGGMGSVYAARDNVLGRKVALKVMFWRGSSRAASRFHKEARAAGRLSHPNTVIVLDFGQAKSKHLYLVMEFITGESLSNWLACNGNMPPDTVVKIFSSVLDGLAHAHANGIIHRDIKPSNIILAKTPQNKIEPKLADFGISRIKEEGQRITRTGVGIGSPWYASPEQARGADADERSDIYSLGCTMFEALSGKPPFDSAHAVSTVLQHISEPAPKLSQVVSLDKYAGELEAIIARCLEKDPVNRFQTAEQLRQALSNITQKEQNPQFSSKETGEKHAANRAYTSKSIVFLGAVLLCIISLVVSFLVLDLTQQAQGPEGFKLKSFKGKKEAELNPIDLADRLVVLHSGTLAWKERRVIIKNKADLQGITTDTRDVSLKDPMVDSHTLEELGKYELYTVYAGGTSITDDGVAAISRIVSLQRLDLGNCHKITGRSADYLVNLQALTWLQMNDTKIDDQGLAAISKLNSLRWLELNGCKKISDAGLKAIARAPKLFWLELRDTRITNQGIENYLSGLTESAGTPESHISVLFVGYCPGITDSGLTLLTRFKSMVSLDLGHTHVTDKGLAHLAKLQKLKHLDLSYTEITSEGLRHLSITNPDLITLSIGNTKGDQDGLIVLSQMRSMKRVDIGGLNLNDRALLRLQSPILESANIAGNRLTVGGIMKWLERNPKIIYLNVDESQKSDLKAAAIRSAQFTELRPALRFESRSFNGEESAILILAKAKESIEDKDLGRDAARRISDDK